MTGKKTKSTKSEDSPEEVRKVEAELLADDHVINTEADPEPDDFETPDSDSSDLPVVQGSVSSVPTTKDPLTMYLQEIRKYPLLTKEQELDLAKKYYETRDPKLAQALVKSNLRFVPTTFQVDVERGFQARYKYQNI